MKVYITKYALTQGIFEREAISREKNSMLVVEPGALNDQYRYYASEWHETFDEAVTHAKYMGYKKVLTLINQITKLEKMEFETPTSLSRQAGNLG